MKLRTFTAGSMPEALAMVRQALGNGAAIVHTRTYKQGGLLGIGGKSIVEITVADPNDSPAAPPPLAGARVPDRSIAQTPSNPAGAGLGAFGVRAPSLPARRTEPETTAGDLIRKTYAVAMRELEKRNGAQGALASAPPSLPAQRADQTPAASVTLSPGWPAPPPRRVPTPAVSPLTLPAQRTMPSVTGVSPTLASPEPAAVSGAGNLRADIRPLSDVTGVAAPRPTPTVAPIAAPGDLLEEMRATQRMVAKMMVQQRMAAARPATGRGAKAKPAQSHDMPGKLFDQYMALLKNEVAEELAEEVIEAARGSLTAQQFDDATSVREAARGAIAKLIPTDPEAAKLEPPADGRPRVIALIGPTGVGKTTTIAKLAATFKLKQKKAVGLITLDTYRIAAVDQLKTYAGIIGVPLHVAMTPEELVTAIHACAAAKCDVVLVDTAGRSQRDDPRLEQLRAFVDAADPHEVHLVLSSTCSQSALMEIVERFSAIRADRIIFTKLDEAVSFGVLVNVARKVKKRLSYVTTGQEVPHQIEPGRSDRLAELVLGGGI